MKDHHRESRYKDDRRKDSRDDRRRNDKDDRRREDRDDKYSRDKKSREDKDHRSKRKHRSSSREPKEKRYRRGDDVDKSPTTDRKGDKAASINKANEEEGGGATEKLSLSIEETNKLRAKLGLKPLMMDESKEKLMTATDKPDVHAPAVNIGDVKKKEALKEKLQVMKEKRRLEESLFKASPLGQVAEEESAAAWVERSRIESTKKQQEEAKARAIDDLSKEFGIGGLVEKEFASSKKTYQANDLQGLKIEHSFNSFKEGRDVILTLKDKGVLEDGEDVLVNVNMVDNEKAVLNIENKKNKPAYNPYDDPEFDDLGNLKEKTVLGKYDDEIRGGPVRESFVIGNQARDDKKPDVARINAITETLKLPELAPVSDYYTPAEMANFKKSNKKMKKNVRKKVKLTADDLLATIQDNEAVKEEEPSAANDSLATNDQPKLPSLDDIENTLKNKYDDDDDLLGLDEDVSTVNDRDWLEAELESKRKNVKQEKTDFDDLVMHIKSEPVEGDGAEVPSNTFYMNSTAEFCRSLGDFMTSSGGPNPFKDEDYDEMEMDQNGNDEASHQGWQSVEIDEKPVEVKIEDNHVLDEEPIIDHGVGTALKLASKKGYLDSIAARQIAPKQSTLEAQNYSIEDKRMDDLDDKYSGRRSKYSSNSGGPIVEFKEKQSYKPEIKLEYVDDQGREMSKKEAFRYLSHKFHGKGSGKKKLEKRMKKAEEDALMRTMSSTDTPLNTAQLLQDKQKANKVPYVVLSGGKGLVTNIITK